MNILRKFVWLLLTLGLLVLTVQTASPIALGLAICMVVLPLMCLPLNLLAAKKLKLSANMPVNLKKGTEGLLEVTVQNPSFFPICLCACRVRLENQLNGEVQSITLSCGVWPKRSQTIRATFGSPFCGRIRLTDYGAFIELTPNLSGLAEDDGTLRVGDHVAVYIRAIVPETLKIKLSVLHRVEPQPREPLRYFQTGGHITQWRYGNEHFAKCYTIF